MNIPGYSRGFSLGGGNVVRTVMYIFAILVLVGGVIISFDERSEFSVVLFFPFLIYAVITFLIGFAIGKILDIQDAKLILMEIQTQNLFPTQETDTSQSELMLPKSILPKDDTVEPPLPEPEPLKARKDEPYQFR